MSHTIMTVEDSISARELISMTLSDAGYNVVESKDGRNALDKMEAGLDPDLVVTDLHMPSMNGIELLENIREISRFRFLPVLFVTTESQISRKMEARDAGATAWITKPFTPDQLLAVVQKILG